MKDLQIGENKSTVPHPLDRPLRTISCWQEWLDMWEKAQSAEQLISLLHWGFSGHIEHSARYVPGGPTEIKKFSRTDRLIFYFRVANGWTPSWLDMSRPGDLATYVFSDPNVSEKNRGNNPALGRDGLRKIVAEKAALILHRVFFNQELPSENDDNFMQTFDNLVPPELLQTLMAYFSISKREYGGFDVGNLPGGTPHAKAVGVFVTKLAPYVWKWEPIQTAEWQEKNGVADEIRARNALMDSIHSKLREWLIHMLCEFGEFALLRKKIDFGDTIEIETLKNRAMHCKISSRSEFGGDMLPTSLYEAIVAGSREAELLVRLEALEEGVRSLKRRSKEAKRLERAKEVLRKAGAT